MASSLARRIAVATVAIPLTIGMVYLGGWVLVGGLVILGAAGTREFFALTRKAGVHPFVIPGYLGAVLLPVTAYLVTSDVGLRPIWMLFGGALWLIATMVYAVGSVRPTDQPVLALGATMFGPCYTAGLLAFLVMVRPPLTEERRKELVKVVKKLAEEGKIAVRHGRTEAISRAKKVEHVSEDDERHTEKAIQKFHDEVIEQLDELVKAKEAEIMEV